ncbi:MAG: glycosyltransferase WbuB [Acidobacteria bacterium]|nr:MAG: glycosyltransferase WbuB [Acidobacteriota bacterium]
MTVLTGFPNHPDGKLRPEYRKHFRRLVFCERAEGVKVIRSWLLPFPNRKAYERILNYASFCLSAGVTGSFLSRPELVIATSPQLLVGLSGWWVAKIKRIPFVLEVRDLWPESLAAVGAGNANSFLYRILHKVAGFLYRKASHIVVVTPAFRDHLIKHWRVRPEKISVIQNGVETKLFCPGASESLRKDLSIENRFVVSYIGTMGMAHGLETMLEAAERLQNATPDVLFMLVGEGAARQRIQAIAAAKELANVRFVTQQPREKIPLYISASDVCLVLLKKSEVFDTVIPTKMLEFMACGKPVVLGVGGQARRILEASRAGLCIEPENASALCEAIEKLRTQDYLRQSLGHNGREFILHNLSRERTATDYLNVLTGMLENRSRAVQAAA